MPLCTYCMKQVDYVEDWGKWKLCEKCIERFKAVFLEQQKIKRSNIKITEPRVGSSAFYSPISGATEITTCPENEICETINHEYIHLLLHRLIGLRCCYQFDNFRKIIDSYHEDL